MLFEMLRASARSWLPTSRSAMSGRAVNGFGSAIVRGTSSVLIRPNVSVVLVLGFRNTLRAASASSMMRRTSA
jgi:hypothetical protein